jgi:hypothetical protein
MVSGLWNNDLIDLITTSLLVIRKILSNMKNNLMRAVIAATLALPSALFFAHPSLAGAQDFVFNNGTEMTIRRLQISATGENSWGRNILRGRRIDPGEAVEINFSNEPECVQDIRAQFEDGSTLQLTEVNLCETNAVTFAAE